MRDLVAVKPTFTIVAREKAEAILNRCTEGIEKHQCYLLYGCIVNTDVSGQRNAINHEALVDAISLEEHIEDQSDTGSILGAFAHHGIATLDQINVSGPALDLLQKMKAFEELNGVVSYDMMPGANHSINSSDPNLHTNTNVSLYLTFSIKDWTKAQLILYQFQDAAKEHKGNIYSAFVRNGDKVKLREAWTSAASLQEHVEGKNGIGAAMETLVEPDIGSLDSLIVAAPRDQIEDALKVFEPFCAKKYEIYRCFARFEM